MARRRIVASVQSLRAVEVRTLCKHSRIRSRSSPVRRAALAGASPNVVHARACAWCWPTWMSPRWRWPRRSWKQRTPVLAVPTDVSRAADVATLAEKTMAAFGGVHLLFNNAGVGVGGAIWEVSEADWAWILGVNLWGVIHGMHVFVPLMLAQGHEAHIVNTASIAGLTASPGLGPYKVTKHGVVTLSETLQYELALRGAPIKVSVLCPGWVQSRIADFERYGRASVDPRSPEEAAASEAVRQAVAAGMTPLELADHVFAAIRAEQFYILPQPEWKAAIRERMEAILGDQKLPIPGR